MSYRRIDIDRTRRGALRGVAAVATAALAGCTESGPQTPEPIQVDLRNRHSKSHRLSVTVEDFDETVLLDGEWSVDPGEDRNAVGTFMPPSPDTKTTVTVVAEMDSSIEVSGDYSVGGSSGLDTFDIVVQEGGRLRILPVRM